ncbi:MAG: nuclear transport factor 2 family protein [Halioglobus sp.]
MQDALDTLLAKQAIYELSCRYMRALDRLDEPLLLSVFFTDAWCDYGFTEGTPAEFARYAITALRSHAANHHMLGNVLLDVAGDEAFGEVYFNAYHKVQGESGFEDVIIAGRYLDRYERRAGIWKFAYRSERVDWSRTQPTCDSYFDLAPDCLRGGRLDDFVYDRENRRRK